MKAGETPEARRRDFLRQMSLIRTLEERLLVLFSEGKLCGTTHTSIGQEAIALAVCSHLNQDDYVFSSHRCHGHFLAYGGPPEALIAEIMGRATGVCGGRGGSQHLHYQRFFTSGVQGGIVGNGTGIGLAQKLLERDGIVVVFLGDGTLGEGLVYESWNFASRHQLPVLYVLENNHYAQTTPIEQAMAGSITARAQAFAIRTAEIESNDVEVLDEAFAEAFMHVRDTRTPFLQVVNTYRLAPHSKGDDHRDKAEIARWREKDPLQVLRARVPESQWREANAEARARVEAAVQAAEAAPLPAPETLSVHVAAQVQAPAETPWATSGERFGKTLNAGLHALLGEDAQTLFLGEDLADPYGGSFGVSRGLSTAFPERVISTPISEAGIIAWATGAALAGMKVIAEIMFADFLALAADQLVNHLSKFCAMYNALEMPVVIRTPAGGHRGYGPTHSQSLETLFCGVPGLTVVAPSLFLEPESLLRRCLYELRQPVLFVENKLMYGAAMRPVPDGRWESFYVESSGQRFPTLRFRLDPEAPADATLICCGANAAMALEAAQILLLQHELLSDVVVCTLMAPVPHAEIQVFTRACGTVITLEESVLAHGWGAEVVAGLAAYGAAGKRFGRVGAACSIIPASGPLERAVLPQVEDVVRAVLESHT